MSGNEIITGSDEGGEPAIEVGVRIATEYFDPKNDTENWRKLRDDVCKAVRNAKCGRIDKALDRHRFGRTKDGVRIEPGMVVYRVEPDGTIREIVPYVRTWGWEKYACYSTREIAEAQLPTHSLAFKGGAV